MPTSVWFDKNRIAHVNGKPFFLIGARHIPEGGSPELLAEAGFNAYRLLTFGNELSRPETLPDTKGEIYFWAYIYDRAVLSRSPEYRGQLEKFVRDVKRHPFFLCYENLNEPALAWKNLPPKALPEELLEGTNLVRKIDPGHPIWIVHSCDRTIDTLRKYNKAADILGCNPYPVQPAGMRQHIGVRPDGKMFDCPDQTLHAVARYTRKMMKVGNNRMPIWMLVQAMANENWYSPVHTPEMARQGIDQSKILYPTLKEMRFMVYDMIIAGATGIAFSMYKTPHGSKVWNDITCVVQELNKLAHALTAPPFQKSFKIRYVDLGYTIWDGVKVLARQYGNKVFLFAANSSFDPARVRITVPDAIGSPRVCVEGENGRTVRIHNHEFSDDFEPFDVHIYRMSTDNTTA